MSNEIWGAIIGAIIGGFLAAISGVSVNWISEKIKRKNLLILFKQAIIDDLNNSKSLFEKIQEEFSKSNTIWFATLKEIRKSHEFYERSRDNILLFKSENLRQKISNFYLKTDNLLNTLEILENIKINISNQLRQTEKELRLKENNLSESELDTKKNDLMKTELMQLQEVKSSMPIQLNKLDRFIIEAQNVIDLLKSNK